MDLTCTTQTFSPKNRIVEMYHAGTPVSSKEHILMPVATDDGDLCILIHTVAFGMGEKGYSFWPF